MPSQNSLGAHDVEGWWPGANGSAPVPPLPELKSPSDLEHKRNWWPGSESTEENQADDNLEMWWTNSMMDRIINSISVDDETPASLSVNKLSAGASNEMENRSTKQRAKNIVPSIADFIMVENEAEMEKENPHRNISLEDPQSGAAVTIQRWFRGWRVRRRQGHSAIQQLLSQKRQEKELQLRNSVTEV